MSYIIKPRKNSAWKKHLRNNLLGEVIMFEKVVVNSSHAKMLTKLLAKVINWAKKGDLHSRRLSLRYLDNRKNNLCLDPETNNEIKLMDKLFNVLGKRYQDRQGGYSRIIKLGTRLGDNSPEVVFSLV
ncbi:MAG: 50S ribosomal protein L17 [Mycoplasmataceae bacterium]|nr:MAG: 50S ribosomal protein L17 [Mycoplasmataceae bacterium]